MFPTLCRSMNTDAPGAGKTIQALLAADSLVPPSHSITVICPAFLVDQWFNVIAEQFPNDSIVSLEGNKSKRDSYFATPARWYIISVQSLRKVPIYEQCHALFIRQHVDFVIIDESHYVKNPDALQSNHVRRLTDPAFVSHVCLLTATPIVKEADDLYHQLRIIDPITFHSQDAFLNKYCYFTWTSWGATNVTLRKSSHALLEAQFIPHTNNELDYTSGYMLGRTYAQIGLEIPPIIPQSETDYGAIVQFELDKQRRKAYDDLKYSWYSMLTSGESLTVSSAMELMHFLRRLTNCPEKMLALTNYMQDDPGPYVIACFYKQSAKELAKFIEHVFPNNGRVPHVISGELDADERIKIAKQYTQPKDVIIATIPSISEGVDLSFANTVYFYEEDYTPGKMYQFLSRIRRHRQNDNLSVTIDDTNHLHVDTDPNDSPIIRRFFHANHSIDQRIHAVQTLRSVNIRDLMKAEVMS